MSGTSVHVSSSQADMKQGVATDVLQQAEHLQRVESL